MLAHAEKGCEESFAKLVPEAEKAAATFAAEQIILQTEATTFANLAGNSLLDAAITADIVAAAD